MAQFKPKTAVIIGGASGIGLAVARQLAAHDVSIMLADLPGDRLAHAAASIDGAVAHDCDVSQLDQVETLADFAFEHFNGVDLVLNNAGIGGPNGKLWDVDPNDARAHFDVNFWGIWNGCRAFAPRLIQQSSESAIYNTGSENSFFCAVPKSAAYIAAKHAVLGLTESLRGDLPDHVHGGLIVPGWVFTPLGPEQFMKLGMDVDEYAATIVPQIMACRRFVVSHGYNTVRIAERMDELVQSYEEFALPPAQDAKHDVRSVMERLKAAAVRSRD